MKILKLKNNNHLQVIKEVSATLKKGGLIIYPTETCYGAGVDATNQKAVDKLLEYKTNRKDKPVSIAVLNKKKVGKYVYLNQVAENIYDNFLPGPITVVSRGKGKLARGIENSKGTQGVRVPNFPFVLKLLRLYKKPITATSANASYKKTPYKISDVLENLSMKQKSLIDIIIDAGTLPKRKPSTVVDTTLENIHILREGSIKLHNPFVYRSESLSDTKNLVDILFKKLSKKLGKKKVTFLLQGDLGAGKTHFAKFLAKKLKVKEIVTSPTFTLCNEYKGSVSNKKVMFYHIDTYRMYNPEEMSDLNPAEIFRAPNIIVIEWANKVYNYLQKFLNNAVVVEISISAPQQKVRIFNYVIKER